MIIWERVHMFLLMFEHIIRNFELSQSPVLVFSFLIEINGNIGIYSVETKSLKKKKMLCGVKIENQQF